MYLESWEEEGDVMDSRFLTAEVIKTARMDTVDHPAVLGQSDEYLPQLGAGAVFKCVNETTKETNDELLLFAFCV